MGERAHFFLRSQLLGLRQAGLTGCSQRSSFPQQALGKQWHTSLFPSPPQPHVSHYKQQLEMLRLWLALWIKGIQPGIFMLLGLVVWGLHITFCPSTKQSFHDLHHRTACVDSSKIHLSIKRRCFSLQCIYNYTSPPWQQAAQVLKAKTLVVMGLNIHRNNMNWHLMHIISSAGFFCVLCV